MKISLMYAGLLAAVLLAACDDDKSRFSYSDPEGGALRLVKHSADAKSITLDFVVGDKPLTGYSTGFTLPVDPALVELAMFTPGTALDAGAEPVAAKGTIATAGPLAGMLVTAQSQKAAGQGAEPNDTVLAPGKVLFSIKLGLAADATEGVVFDGTAADFALPSGGLRDRSGVTVVAKTDVAIGKLVVNK